ncbi:MAG: hypothetical protein IKT20_01060 [Clostridiales bacterium]|nr:hypothetical protein [Clostridiales bacterium]
MKKLLLPFLITAILLSGVHTTVFAGSLYRMDPETVEETTADTMPEDTAAPTDATEAPTDTAVPPEETTPAETVPEETPPEDTTVEDTTVTEPTETAESIPAETEANEATSAATETASNGIDMFKKGDKKDLEPEPEKKKDPRIAVAIAFLILGLILGIGSGYALGWYMHRRRVNHQHDTVYEAIKYGETHETLIQSKAEAEAQRKEEAEKRKAEKAALAKRTKADREKAKAEAERQKLLKEYKDMQKKLGIIVEDDVGTLAQEEEQEEKPAMIDRMITFLEKKRDKQKEDRQEQQAAVVPEYEIEQEPFSEPIFNEPLPEAPQPQPVTESEPEPARAEKPQKRSKPAVIRPEDMEYGGVDAAGDTYYYDPDDDEGEPFKIVDGKKVFYD